MVSSRPLLLTCLLAVTAFAGCLGANGSMDAAAAAQIGDDHVRASYHDAIFLGIAAAEGPIDPELLQQSLEEESERDATVQEMLDTFDFRVRNGDMADGLTGTWFLVHGTPKAIIITQVIEAGSEARSVEIPFEPVYMDEPSADAQTPPPFSPLARLLGPIHSSDHVTPSTSTNQEDAATCVSSSEPAPGLLDSARVAEVAMDQAAFADAVASDPDNDILYFFANEDCNESYWSVATLDIDNLLRDEPQPFSGAWLAIDPRDDYRVVELETFDVTEEDLNGEFGLGSSRATESYFGTESFHGGPVPSLVTSEPAVHDININVPEDGIELFVLAQGYADQALAEDGSLQVIAPDGTPYDAQGDIWSVQEPDAGTWILRYTFDTTVPLEQHEVYYEITVSWWA